MLGVAVILLHLVFDAAAPHFTVLFVPAGAGVLAHLYLIADDLPIVVLVVVAGTLATTAVTALVGAAVLARDDAPGASP